MDAFGTTASIFGLSAIGIDRYVAITRPMEYSNSFISKRWYYVLSFIWICSAVTSVPPVIFIGREQVSTRLERSNKSNATIIKTLLPLDECNVPTDPYYILFICIASFYLPLIIMIYVYIQMYLAAKKQTRALRSGYKYHSSMQSTTSSITKVPLRQMFSDRRFEIEERAEISDDNAHEKSEMLLQKRRPSYELLTLRIHHGTYKNPNIEEFNQNNEHNTKSLNKFPRKYEQKKKFWQQISKNQKAGKFVGTIMGVFIVCWLPFHAYFLLSGVFGLRLKDEQNHELLFYIFSWLGYTNSALDVLIYSLASNELRTLFMKLFYIMSIEDF
ncbi:unnamed protein product [Rotaria sordida]|uniref:G-protein coupled receptors family 1 profile domain-containing protein n=1 Tax=Rotaria sordida TaxID=392033 RepID=A0A815FK46_9BILA|nr:unnamed protein product [Rotaria sordida]